MIATSDRPTKHPHPARSEPLFWILVVGLPAVAVAASIWLLAAAIGSGGADEVADDVRATGEIQVGELGPDVRAQSLKLAAVLRIGSERIDVLPVKGAFARAQPLLLTLGHPVDAGRDLRLLLQPTASGWSAATKLPAGHDWIARLGPADGSWRLRGRLHEGSGTTWLGPAFAGE